MYNDLVSIIMPAYNCDKYINEAILSVQQQTVKNWELIIVDDCSKDNTVEVIEQYTKVDNRIKLVKLPINQGVVNARNTALRLARGRYISFLDSDDRWKNEKLEMQLKFMRDIGCSFSFTAYEYIDSESNKINKIVSAPEYQNYEKGLKNTIIGCSTVIIDKSKTGFFDMPELNHGEDHFTWLTLMKNGHMAYGLNMCLSEYRLNPDSLSSNKLNALKNQWKNYRTVANLPLYSCFYYYSCYIFNAILKRI